MRKPVTQDVNRENLLEISRILRGCECFPFFGTLLGLTRDGDIIPHDDDVDIYVSAGHRNEVLDRLAKSDFIVDHSDEVNSTPWFMQAKRSFDDLDSYVDFYFYEGDVVRNHLVERWNFTGVWSSDDNHIHIPSELIYPITSKVYFGTEVAMPADPEGCCAFLYGSEWRRPLIKQLGYTTQIRNHVPSIEVKANQFAEIIRHFHLIDDALSEAREERADLERRLSEIEATRWWRARELGVDVINLLRSPFRHLKS